jgi:hypothetical protein
MHVHIATRHYHDIHPQTREEFSLQDRLFRIGEQTFDLYVAGELPGDPEVVTSLSLDEVMAWYRECPEQIERVVLAR